jgi:hypothetical protein
MTSIAWRMCPAFQIGGGVHGRRRKRSAEAMTIEREATVVDSATTADLTARVGRLQSERDSASADALSASEPSSVAAALT